MAPEVLLAKIQQLQEVLSDLQPNLGRSREEQEGRHYEIERQVQLVADFSVAIARRMLVLRGDPVPEMDRFLAGLKDGYASFVEFASAAAGPS